MRLVVYCVACVVTAPGLFLVSRSPPYASPAGQPPTSAPNVVENSPPRDLSTILSLRDSALEHIDVIELNLSIARELPECRDLDVRRYQRTVDEWASRIKQEIERHQYRFEHNPGEYKNSQAYFRALMMCTVVGQDYGVSYDLEDFSLDQPEDLFIHGVIDRRKGSCVSLPVLYVALGQRLGYPIRGVAVPGHTFCRWDDPVTGERHNIESANLGGLTDHDDEYYRHWPYEVDPRWEREHHVLKSLSMREYAAVMVGCLGAYYQAKRDYPSAIRWDALAHWLDPANRSTFVSLCLSVDGTRRRYLDAEELAGRKKYWELTPHSTAKQRADTPLMDRTRAQLVRSTSN
jgi:regulator of sirC expression with transglutaminase-like and TPR domain